MNRCALIIKKSGQFQLCFDDINAIKSNILKGPQIYSKLNITGLRELDNTYICFVCLIDLDVNAYYVYKTADFTSINWEYLVA